MSKADNLVIELAGALREMLWLEEKRDRIPRHYSEHAEMKFNERKARAIENAERLLLLFQVEGPR